MQVKIDRRDSIKTVGLGAASLTITGCTNISHLVSNKPSVDKPNIVLMMADDLGYECLGCYGRDPASQEPSTSYKTPVRFASIAPVRLTAHVQPPTGKLPQIRSIHLLS